MTYKDFTLNLSEYGNCEKLSDSNSILYAIKNIILSRPGNYPLMPDLGINIQKYQFELLDDYTISTIKSDLLKQITKYIPTIDDVQVTVQKVEDVVNGEYKNAVGISVSIMESGEESTGNFLVIKDNETLNIYNEII